MSDEMKSYAEIWADHIKYVYDGNHDEGVRADRVLAMFEDDDLLDGEDHHDAEVRIMTKAAKCLRRNEEITVSGAELDLIRHLMPAHEVNRSAAARFVWERYGVTDAGITAEDLMRIYEQNPGVGFDDVLNDDFRFIHTVYGWKHVEDCTVAELTASIEVWRMDLDNVEGKLQDLETLRDDLEAAETLPDDVVKLAEQ